MAEESPTGASELRAWIQTLVTVGSAIVGTVVAFGLTDSVRALTRPRPIEFVSGSHWHGNDRWYEGWSNLAFDDSKWRPAGVLLLSESLAERDSAPRIWAPSLAETCYLRADFEISRDEVERYRTATLLAKVDDDFNLHVNGTRISTPRAGGADVTAMDIYPWLRPGKNVIAVNAWNTGGAGRGVSLKVTLR